MSRRIKKSARRIQKFLEKISAFSGFFISWFLNPFFQAILSGLFLAAAFPNSSKPFLAWVALVPLLAAVRHAKSKSQAFSYGFTAGVVFFLFSIHWLIHVTTFGWLFLTAVESLFFGLFAWAVYEGRGFSSFYPRIFWSALAWTSSEFLRAVFPVFGFGWNLLGYSQSENLLVIQSANTVGVYGLGFGIALVNACLAECLASAGDGFARFLKKCWFAFFFSVIFLPALFIHGLYHFRIPGQTVGTWKISLIQGNIPQSVKWEPMARGKIIEVYTKLTEIVSFDKPDLVIWPEAAFPGYFNKDLDTVSVFEIQKKTGIPIVVGAPHLEENDVAYNSAYLVNAGEIKQRYDKQNLVPFGEYVPLKPFLSFLTPLAYSLGVSDFTAGRVKTVFEIMNREVSFSVLICFEDVFPDLAREFVDRGANFLAVITNDAWFGKSAAPFQHLQASVFRAIENGVPVVRAANTGVSAFISQRGEILERVEDGQGESIFVTGAETFALPVRNKETFYRKGGWLFPHVVTGCFVIMLTLMKFRRKNAQETI